MGTHGVRTTRTELTSQGPSKAREDDPSDAKGGFGLPSCLGGGGGEVIAIAYDHNARRCSVATRDGGTLAVYVKDASDAWDMEREWTCTGHEVNGTEGPSPGMEGGLHAGPVTQVAWAHSEFGQVFASASADGFVCVWFERSPGQWDLASSFKCSRTPCLCLKFSPHQYGLNLGVSSGDGHIRIYRSEDHTNLSDWQLTQDLYACGARSDPSPCPCFCWRPYSQDVPEMLLVGCRSSCSVWSFDGHLGRWTRVADLAEHDGGVGDVVEDVDWASPCGKTAELVAFARGAAAFVVQLREGPGGVLAVSTVARCDHGKGAGTGGGGRVAQVEWNRLGTTLATSGDDGVVRLWRPDLTDEWHEMAAIVGGDG